MAVGDDAVVHELDDGGGVGWQEAMMQWSMSWMMEVVLGGRRR